MVVLDLQPEEVERFRQIVDQEIETYPVIRARIFSIDGVEIAQEEPLRDEEITRSFNLTYRSELIAGETLVAGEMASEESEEQVVSVSRAEAERFGIELGSEIIFDIQGRQIPLEVNSIRQLELTEFQPFFYFVTPPKVLERSPQTTFSFLTLRADQDIDEIQDRLASEFTGVSILRVKEALEKVQILTNSIAYIIIYISQLTAILGLIMLTGLLVASSEERKNDFMLMKVLGSRPSQLVYLYALELIFYVLIAFMLAYFLAALSAFLIGKYVFEFSTFVWDFAPFIVLAITLVLVLIIGALIMRTVFKEKPMQFLRNSN
jgi:putative ABC transport system permease protein